MREAEKRWQCDGCKKFLKEDQFNTIKYEFIEKDLVVREHMVTKPYSPSGGRLIGCHMRTTRCGTVEQVEVSVQEQFVEWVGA